MSIEIEAKFLITGRDTHDRIRAVTRIGRYSLLEARTENVVDVYMDTEERALLSAGYACRHREREGAHLVTVKSVASSGGDVHRREELEVTIPHDAAPAAWPASAAREKVLGLIGASPLKELFRLRQSRFVRPVVDGDRRVASASLDDVSVGTGNAAREWSELEVELAPTGTEADLAAISGWLRTTAGLHPATISKFERALDLFGGPTGERRPAPGQHRCAGGKPRRD